MERKIPLLLAAAVALMPLLAPITLSDAPFNVAPESMKTAWGILSVLSLSGVLMWAALKKREICYKKSPVLFPVLLLVVWCLLSLLWVEDGFLAAIMLAQLFSYALVLFLTLSLFEKYDVEKSFVWLIFSMTLVSLICLTQYYLPSHDWVQNFFIQTAKPGATFANKNMASHFIVMTIPFSLIGLLASVSRKQRYLYGFATAIGLWFLIYTVARQAYLAVLVEFVLLALFFVVDYFKHREKSLILSTPEWRSNVQSLVGVVLFLVLVSNWAAGDGNDQGNAKLEKATNISIQAGSSRFPAWLNTIEMIKERPFGVGIGQWPESYPQYYDRVEKDVIFNEKVKLKRLHNDYLEMFANVGIVGYVALLWLALIVIKVIFSCLMDNMCEYRWRVLALSLGLSGFTVIAMFSFPTRVYLPAFLVFFYIGMVIVLTGRLTAVKIQLNGLNFTIAAVGALLLSVATVSVAKVSYDWLMAENHFLRSQALANVGEVRLAAGGGLEALKYNHWAPDYYTATGINLVRLEKAEDAIPLLKKAIDISPYNSDALLVLSLAYRHLKQIEMERKVLLFVMSFDSKNVRASAYLVRHFYEKGEYEKANYFYKKLKYNYKYFLDRENFGPYHELIGLVASSVGDYRYARYSYENAIENKASVDNYMKLATLEFHHLGNKARGVELFNQVLDIEPETKHREEILKLINQYKEENQ